MSEPAIRCIAVVGLLDAINEGSIAPPYPSLDEDAIDPPSDTAVRPTRADRENVKDEPLSRPSAPLRVQPNVPVERLSIASATTPTNSASPLQPGWCDPFTLNE